jgi:hypothetical protein
MNRKHTDKNDNLDLQLDKLLAAKPVQARSDFLESIHFQLDATSEVLDPKLEALLKAQPVKAPVSLLEQIREKLAPATEIGDRIIRFPIWATRIAAAAAVIAFSAILWLPQQQVHQPISDTTVSLTTPAGRIAENHQDPQLTQILALAQNLQPGQNLKNLDKGIESMLVFMD